MSTHLPKLSYYFCVLLLICHSETALSVIILTPTIVSLCPGDWLRLTCNTSTHFHQWAVIDPNTGMTYTRTIEVPATSKAAITPLEVQSLTFSFAIISAPNTLPLISTLTVDGVTNYLNMSRISCLEIDTGNIEMVNVHIIRPDTLEGVHVDYHLVDSIFGINNATVSLQFNESSQENDYHGSKLVSYNVTSSSQVEIKYQRRTDFQLVIPYNTHVNVSIFASLCGQHSTPTIFCLNYSYLSCKFLSQESSEPVSYAFSTSSYMLLEEFPSTTEVNTSNEHSHVSWRYVGRANCGDPPVQHAHSDAERNDSVKVTGNTQDIPVMEGTTVSFSCYPGLILSGPNSSTCTGSGEWEPDPREVECAMELPECETPVNNNKVVYEYNSTTEGSKLIFYCKDNPDELYIAQCYGNETWIPNIALITCGDHDQSTVSEEMPFNSGPNSTNTTQTITVTAVTVVVGTLFGVIFIIVSTISVALTLKKKGFSHIHRKKLNNQSVTPQTQMIQSVNGHDSQQLVYADLGPSSIKQSAISLSLLDDNTRIEYARLNYNATQEQQSMIRTKIEDEHPADKLLNLDTLLIQLKGQLTTRWYIFGEAIGLKKEDLEKFTNYLPEQSIVEMLDYWLRNHTGQPTWKEIAGALRQLGLWHLSLEIEQIYETGQLSFNETDIVEVPSVLREPEPEFPPSVPPKKQNFSVAPSSAAMLENTAPSLPPKGASYQLPEITPPRPPKPRSYDQ